MRTTLFFTLLVFAGQAMPSQAQQYGWPPPNYSVTGVRAEDGYQYRNLRQVLREHGCGWRLREMRAAWTGVGLDVDGPPPGQRYAPLAAAISAQVELLPPPRSQEKQTPAAP